MKRGVVVLLGLLIFVVGFFSPTNLRAQTAASAVVVGTAAYVAPGAGDLAGFRRKHIARSKKRLPQLTRLLRQSKMWA